MEMKEERERESVREGERESGKREREYRGMCIALFASIALFFLFPCVMDRKHV